MFLTRVSVKSTEEDKILATESYLLSEYPLYLFNEGTNYYSYKTLGVHPHEDGYRFAVWAPNAKKVSVAGDFNNWDPNKNILKMQKKFGIWEGYIPEAREGMYYKFHIISCKGEKIYKADPYAFASELRPGDASKITNLNNYEWRDSEYYKSMEAPYDTPVLIYEIHPGSWRRNPDGSFYTYRQLADTLIKYVKDMGFTHIELMAIAEHPFDGSWGYQVTGYYSVTSRYGTPDDFKYFVDKCHQAGIKIIMDWVPAHFPKDKFGLSEFDGTYLYEYADKRLGEHLEWGTKVFNCRRAEVVSFLISNAMFWFDVYHIDGLRVDAVSSMLYLDYNRKKDEWVPNQYGGNENLDAIDFFQKLNSVVFKEYPYAMMVAEESTAWANVTKPVDIGGLGFNFKWNMGWMNDLLRYMALDPIHRRYHHQTLTFSIHYAFSENYILPLSHDEVVHGKYSLLNKMSGTYEQKFETLRAFYAYMFAHPGKKLLFMGGEFGQFIEWDIGKELDWLLLDYEKHNNLKNYFKELIHTYKKTKALWENDRTWDGFRWINLSDKKKSIISFIRINKSAQQKVIVLSNFSAAKHKNYAIGVPSKGTYRIFFTSSEMGEEDQREFVSSKMECDGFANRIQLDVPPLTTFYIKKIGPSKK